MNKNLIDVDLLTNLQEQFCRANDLYLACLDRNRNVLVSHYGTKEEQQYFAETVPNGREVATKLFEAVEISQVESIIEEELEVPYIKMCSVITRVDGAITLVWMITAVIEELIPEGVEVPENVLRTSEKDFYASVAFLESLTKMLFLIKEHETQAKEAMELAQQNEAQYKELYQRSSAMEDVVHMLESEEAFAQLVDKAIREVCETLDIQGGCLIQKSTDGMTADVICEFTMKKSWDLGDRLQGAAISRLPFFDGKPYMLSSDSMMPEVMESFFTRYHLCAGVFQPIEINGRSDMYLCFYEFEKDRTWNVEDIKFINEVKRVVQEILVRRVAKNSLAGSYASLEAILENVGCAIYVVDYDRKEVLYTNHRFRQLVARDIDNKDFNDYFFKDPNVEREFPLREVHLKKHDIWLDMNQTGLKWVDGRQVSLGTIYDITEKKKYQQKIEKQISNDNLTGLFNRMRCEQDLVQYIKEAEKTGQEGAFLWIDLDDFQNINDGLGHQYGDTLLKAIAQNLARVPGVENNCYRMGGDEFAVIVQGSRYRELSRICKDLREIFERPWFLKTEDYYCTMSMGVACFPTDGNTVEDLIRKVSMALASAKKRGKNCVEFYNEKVEDSPFYRLDLEQNMRRATLNSCNEFEVYYQPIFSQKEGKERCCGAEALVRWNSSELGFIPPKDFIPLAEYLGLINPIGEHVLEEAVKRCKYWNDCGHPDYKVNVNLSVIQLLQSDFVTKVRQVLEKTNINPKNVTLEVTESLAINDMERMKKVLQKLKDLGVRVALDDFGTGYSSLNHIREMPIDVIKIDQCFVENLAEDEFAIAFVKMVSELARTLGVSVCVEGIEQRKQLDVLKDMNVNMIQGFYYGKPMPVKEFEKIYL